MHEAIEAERKLAKDEKRPPRGPQTIQSPWRDRDPKPRRPPASSRSLRLKAPREGETVIDDKVQGRVVVQNSQLDDMVILRSDGTPIYNFAVVVDDHDMGDNARDPRRRSSDQRRAAGADLRRPWAGRAGSSPTCR